jgi:DNA polymerase III gamma/tau subunit
VLQLLGAVEEEALFRLLDLVVDRDTAGALTFVEELSEQGQDLGRLVVDLLEHLRHLLLVQHMGEVPESLPVTEETRDRLREQANQLGEATVLRLIDLLHVAVEDMRQGGDPRLPLELALVKVTRAGSDLSRESVAYRLEQLEQRGHASPPVPSELVAQSHEPSDPAPPTPPSLELEQLQEAWQRTILPAVEERSIPTASVLREARPSELDDDRLTVEFPSSAEFHLKLAEDPKNATLLQDALYEVTGRKLALAFALGEHGHGHEDEAEEPLGEDEILELVKETFDARELKEGE